MLYLYEDEQGNRIKDDEATIARVLQQISSDKATSVRLVSDIGQTLRPRRPVRPGEDHIFFEITTVTWSSRNERWPISKLSRYLDAGILVRDGGAAYERWTRPSKPAMQSDAPVNIEPVTDPVGMKIVIRKAMDLESQLRAAGRLVHADGMRNLLELTDKDSPGDIGVLRAYTEAVKEVLRTLNADTPSPPRP